VDLKAKGVLADGIRCDDGTKANDDGATVSANRTAADENLMLTIVYLQLFLLF
jgi:hypothetical protein